MPGLDPGIMGYPDDSFPANRVRSDREENGSFVRYVGFAD